MNVRTTQARLARAINGADQIREEVKRAERRRCSLEARFFAAKAKLGVARCRAGASEDRNAQLVAARAEFHRAGTRLVQELRDGEALNEMLRDELAAIDGEIARSERLLEAHPRSGGRVWLVLFLVGLLGLAELAGAPVLETLKDLLAQVTA